MKNPIKNLLPSNPGNLPNPIEPKMQLPVAPSLIEQASIFQNEVQRLINALAEANKFGTEQAQRAQLSEMAYAKMEKHYEDHFQQMKRHYEEHSAQQDTIFKDALARQDAIFKDTTANLKDELHHALNAKEAFEYDCINMKNRLDNIIKTLTVPAASAKEALNNIGKEHEEHHYDEESTAPVTPVDLDHEMKQTVSSEFHNKEQTP